MKIGDRVPQTLERQCEEILSPDGGFRLIYQGHLYLLDRSYTVTGIMAMVDHETGGHEQEGDAQVVQLVRFFRRALKKYQLKVDFFTRSVLGKANVPVLCAAYSGDLSDLNDDTREAILQGKSVHVQPAGFSFLKAVMIHELYIKSTVAGRGDNLPEFLTAVVRFGDREAAQTPAPKSVTKQKQLVSWMGRQSLVYADKKDILQRLHLEIKGRIIREFAELEFEDPDFRAFLIFKLYQKTTRLDRGDGITMISLTRDIIEFKA